MILPECSATVYALRASTTGCGYAAFVSMCHVHCGRLEVMLSVMKDSKKESSRETVLGLLFWGFITLLIVASCIGFGPGRCALMLSQ